MSGRSFLCDQRRGAMPALPAASGSPGGRITPRKIPEYEANAQPPLWKRRGSRQSMLSTSTDPLDPGDVRSVIWPASGCEA